MNNKIPITIDTSGVTNNGQGHNVAPGVSIPGFSGDEYQSDAYVRD